MWYITRPNLIGILFTSMKATHVCLCCFESNWHEVELIKRRKNKHDDTIIWESNMAMY